MYIISASTKTTPETIARKIVDLNAEMQRFEKFLAELQEDENPSKQPVEVKGKQPELDMDKEKVTKHTGIHYGTTSSMS